MASISVYQNFTILIVYFILLILLPIPSQSSDPDPLQDFCVADLNGVISLNGFPCKPPSKVTSDDFFFDGFTKEINTSNLVGLNVIHGNVLSFPGLNTLGISMVRVDIARGGFGPPSIHPRASVAGVIIEGKVLVGFLTTENVYYSKILNPGEMFVIPKGLVHFLANVGQEKAMFYAAFNSHLPGVLSVSRNLFGSKPSVPDDILSNAFQVEQTVIGKIKSKFGNLILS